MFSNVSRECRIEWCKKGGAKGGKTTAERRTPSQRILSAKIAANARAETYSHEELQKIYVNQLNQRLAGMSPEEARNFQQKAGKARMERMTPEERSKLARRAIRIRLARIAYARDPGPADRLYAFLSDFISAKRYSPTLREISQALHRDQQTIERLLQMLEASGRLKRQPWQRGIVLSNGIKSALAALSLVQPAQQIPVEVVMPRASRKCYDCDEPAVAGKTRCERHLARANEASKRSHARKLP